MCFENGVERTRIDLWNQLVWSYVDYLHYLGVSSRRKGTRAYASFSSTNSGEFFSIPITRRPNAHNNYSSQEAFLFSSWWWHSSSRLIIFPTSIKPKAIRRREVVSISYHSWCQWSQEYYVVVELLAKLDGIGTVSLWDRSLPLLVQDYYSRLMWILQILVLLDFKFFWVLESDWRGRCLVRILVFDSLMVLRLMRSS